MKIQFSAGILVLMTLLQATEDNGRSQATSTNGASVPTPAPAAPVISAPMPASPMPVYRPPGVTGDVLPIRVGGGSRGSATDGVNVEVLVPDDIALTTEAQPSLYWYQSKTARTDCEVTVTKPKIAKPVRVLRSSSPTKEGIHLIDLSKFKVNLEPNVTYKWSVAIVIDPKNRSEDIIAYGVIKRVDPAPELTNQLASASEVEKPAIYANAGIWYDALDSLSRLITKNPNDQALQEQRAMLLKQIGLNGAAIEQNAMVKSGDR